MRFQCLMKDSWRTGNIYVITELGIGGLGSIKTINEDDDTDPMFAYWAPEGGGLFNLANKKKWKLITNFWEAD